MSVATSTAIAIGAGISAGTAIYGAHEAASASKTAAAQQEQASDKALQFEEQAYNTQQGELLPYRDAGLVGLNNLEALARQPYQMTPGAMGWVGLNSLTPPPTAAPAGLSGAIPEFLAAGAAAAPSAAGATPTGAAPGGGMVMVQAPTGETRMMPASQAQPFLARGARLVPMTPNTGLASLDGGGRI